MIQHSAGSGKSNSIAWLAHQSIGLHDATGEHNVFDAMIVVTDRTVLDVQLRETIRQFDQVNIIEGITGESKDIRRLDPGNDKTGKPARANTSGWRWSLAKRSSSAPSKPFRS